MLHSFVNRYQQPKREETNQQWHRKSMEKQIVPWNWNLKPSPGFGNPKAWSPICTVCFIHVAKTIESCLFNDKQNHPKTYESQSLSQISLQVFQNKPESTGFFSKKTPCLYPNIYNLRAEVCEDHQQFLRLCLWIFGQFLPPDCHTTHGAGAAGVAFFDDVFVWGNGRKWIYDKTFPFGLVGLLEVLKILNYVGKKCRRTNFHRECYLVF